MKRRDFISAVGAVVAWPFAARARQQERSQNAGGLEEAKHRFDKISQPSEAARSDYVTRLVRIREEMARQKNDEWKAIDNEIGEHPAPKDSDAKVLSRRLVGKWSSPRHDYLYRRDGSWTMLPADEGTTHLAKLIQHLPIAIVMCGIVLTAVWVTTILGLGVVSLLELVI